MSLVPARQSHYESAFSAGEAFNESALVDEDDNEEDRQPGAQQRPFWHTLLTPGRALTGGLVALTGCVLLYKYFWSRQV